MQASVSEPEPKLGGPGRRRGMALRALVADVVQIVADLARLHRAGRQRRGHDLEIALRERRGLEPAAGGLVAQEDRQEAGILFFASSRAT